MTSAPRLDDLEDIKKLKARYFRCLDTRDWEGYASTFAPDGSLEVESVQSAKNGESKISRREEGREAIVQWVSSVLTGATTIHHGHMPELTIIAPDRASGIWAMEDRVIWADRRLHGFGHYHEIYVRAEDRWTIWSSRLTRLHVEVDHAAGATPEGRLQMLDSASSGEVER